VVVLLEYPTPGVVIYELIQNRCAHPRIIRQMMLGIINYSAPTLNECSVLLIEFLLRQAGRPPSENLLIPELQVTVVNLPEMFIGHIGYRLCVSDDTIVGSIPKLVEV